MRTLEATNAIITLLESDSALRDWARAYSGNGQFIFNEGTTLLRTVDVDDATLFSQSRVPYNPQLYIVLPDGENYNDRRCKDILRYQIIGFLRSGTQPILEGIEDYCYNVMNIFTNIQYTTSGFIYRYMTLLGESMDDPTDPECVSFVLQLEYINTRG